MHVSPYEFSRGELDPVRPRKLLLHHKQIVELARATEEKGITLVPLRVYFKDGRGKVELATARGKARYDKRQAIAERDAKRETERDAEGRSRLRDRLVAERRLRLALGLRATSTSERLALDVDPRAATRATSGTTSCGRRAAPSSPARARGARASRR